MKKIIYTLIIALALMSTQTYGLAKLLKKYKFNKKLHVRFGFGASGDYFAKSGVLGTLGGGLGGGAFKQEFEKFDTVEQAIALTNPSQVQGGCPDVPAVALRTAKQLGSISAPAQIFTIDGKRCSVEESEGSSLLMLGVDVEIGVQYNFYKDFFIQTGLVRSIIFPASYMARFRYLGVSQNVQVNGLTDPLTGLPISSIGADVLIDSSVFVEHSGFVYQFPIMVGVDFYRKGNTRLYISIGGVFSAASYERRTRATQSATVQADGQTFDLSSSNYIETVNTESIFTFGIATTVGGQYQLTDTLSAYIELRWLKSGSATTIRGTNIEDGKEYASDTFAAQALESAAPGATAKALQVSENKNGARTANGLDIGYSARWIIGVSYTR